MMYLHITNRNVKLISRAICMSALVGVFMTACDKSTESSSVRISEQSTLKKPSLNAPAIRAPSELSHHAAQLADAVQQSQARLASSRSDVCPKLIEFKVGDTINFRQNETMRNQDCKYFIYPRVGEKFAVSVSNKSMKAEMVQPQYYNFENGAYVVKKSGKHVLKIAYKSYHGSRPAEQYDLTVSTR